MNIGLLSDTHGYIDEKVYDHFQSCDEIWHAGDIGSSEVLTKLESFKPLKAVWGNIDNKAIQSLLPEDLWFDCEGMKVFMTHIGGYPPRFNKRIREILKVRVPDLFICGHSHILKIMTDPSHNKMLYINPGAAGQQGFHKVKTLVRFSILEGQLKTLQVIELGSRAQIL